MAQDERSAGQKDKTDPDIKNANWHRRKDRNPR